MEIVRLQSVTEPQVQDILALMRELDPEIAVTPAMVRRAVEAPGTCFLVLLDASRIVGCASLCVFCSPTGCKAHIEDVVLLAEYRGRQLGRRLVERLIEYARTELLPGLQAVDLYLTSRPQRVAANELYQSLGFRRKETNVYKLEIRE